MRKCLKCNKEFKPSDNRQKYCSKTCCSASYYSKNKEKIKECTKRYSLNNKDKVSKWNHITYLNLKKKNYYNEYYKNKWHNNSEFRRKQSVRNLHQQIRKRLLKDKCEFCGTTEDLQLHHIDYEYTVNTLKVKTLCKKCHNLVHNSTI